MTRQESNSWQSIQAELRRRINERVWQPGEQVPNEAELAAEFGCARTTVNRAMRELAAAGLLDRRRKAGTKVALNPVRKATLNIPITRLEVERRGARWGHAVLERETVTPPALIASRLGLSHDTELLHLRSLHCADHQPFLYEDRWINLAAVPEVLEADFGAVSANEWLVQNAPFTRGDISLSAANATATEAEGLGVGEGAALFIVERVTWDGKRPVTAVRLAYTPGYQMHTVI